MVTLRVATIPVRRAVVPQAPVRRARHAAAAAAVRQRRQLLHHVADERRHRITPAEIQADDPTWEKEVSFRLAKALDEPYQVRVTRIYRDRPRWRGTWEEHLSQQLDVSLGSGIEDNPADQGVDS